MDSVHFILTGGTIDKAYDTVTETPQPGTSSVVPDYFTSKIKPHVDVSFENICLLDSNDITEEIREKILIAIQNSKTTKIIIVHGTSAMTDTADYLLNTLDKEHGKTIVMVGSMIPMKEFAMSDAGFNLGYAMAQVQNMDSGIYICMHAKTFEAGSVHKDTTQARFEKL